MLVCVLLVLCKRQAAVAAAFVDGGRVGVEWNAKASRSISNHCPRQFATSQDWFGNYLYEPSQESVGTVVRLATKAYHPVDSKPSSRDYTTRKDECLQVLRVTQAGAVGDYNHFRTAALKGTPERALSILTTDCLDLLQSYGFPVEPGDLGENILVNATVGFQFFVSGAVYRFESRTPTEGERHHSDAVDIRITEPMIPCANLCKLHYINDESKSLPERVDRCQEMLRILSPAPGLRGWYAAVLANTASDGVQTIQADSIVRRIVSHHSNNIP